VDIAGMFILSRKSPIFSPPTTVGIEPILPNLASIDPLPPLLRRYEQLRMGEHASKFFKKQL